MPPTEIVSNVLEPARLMALFQFIALAPPDAWLICTCSSGTESENTEVGSPANVAPLRLALIAVHVRWSVASCGCRVATASVPLLTESPTPLTPMKRSLTVSESVARFAPSSSTALTFASTVSVEVPDASNFVPSKSIVWPLTETSPPKF